MIDRQPEARGGSWQAMDSGQVLLVAAAGLLAVAAIAQVAAAGIVQAGDAVAFGSLVALGELLRIRLPGNRESAPIAAAGALGYALLLDIGDRPAVQSALQVIVITVGGMIVGALPHLAAGRPAKLDRMASRLIAVACVAFVFRPLAPTALIRGHWWPALAVMALLVVLAWFVDAVLSALIRAEQLRARFSVALWDELRVQLPLGAAVGASALLIAFSSEVMGLAAVWVFTGPLLVSQVAFRRYAGIRATYLETVRALSRMTEVGGYVEGGHSRRVSRLAVAVGRELGMNEPELLELEYAALMHDIGQLSLRDPIPGGATVLVSLGRPAAHRRARRRRDTPGRRPGPGRGYRRQTERARAGPGASPPVASRIIRAANAFDDLVGSSADRDRASAALERLRLDTASEYDPGVIEALSKVAGRRALSRA